MKTAGIALFTFLLGTLAGYIFFAGNPGPEVETVTKVVTKEVPVEVTKEVVDTKSIEEAKEYYSKAFNLFLVTVGYKLNQKTRGTFNSLIDDPKAYIDSKPATRVTSKEPEFFIPKVEPELDEEFSPYDNKDKKADFSNIDDRGLLARTKRFALKEPALFRAKSKIIKTYKKIKRMNGRFDGKLYRVKGKHKGSVEEVILEVDFKQKEDNKIEGSFSLKLIRDGNNYSHKSGTGGNGAIRVRKGTILIDASPGTFFHFLDKKLRFANFYDEGELVGIAKFRKR